MKNLRYIVIRLSLALAFFLGTQIVSSETLAELTLDSPEKIMEKASSGRQELRDVVLSIQQQLPEMRSQKVFESYFFLLQRLDVLAIQFDLNDVYPGAIKSLGIRMSLFGIKWMDLSQMNQETFKYYTEWLDGDGYSNLLGITNYILQTMEVKESARFKHLAENIDFLIGLNLEVIRLRPDLGLGYRELISQLAIRFVQDPNSSEAERDYWFGKIYSASGLSLYLDSLQKQLFSLDPMTKLMIPGIQQGLMRAYLRSAVIFDFAVGALRERISEMAVELIKKSLELNSPLRRGQLEEFFAQFSPRSLQLMSMTLISTPENFLIDNAETLEELYALLLPRLTQNSLLTEANNLEIFIGKSLAALKIRNFKLEGTYRLEDGQGKFWNFTLLSTRPLDLAAGLADEKWMIFRNYFYLRYNPQDQVFTATYSQNEFENLNQSKSVLRIRFEGQKIRLIDDYAMPGSQDLRGKLVEKVEPLHFSQVASPSFSRTLKGQIKFRLGAHPRSVKMIVQSSGLNITGRIQDDSGPLLDFNQGFISADGTLIMSTGRLQNTTWAQFRGRLTDAGIRGVLYMAGRGLNSEEFFLK